MNNTQEIRNGYTPKFEEAVIKLFLEIPLNNVSEKLYSAVVRKYDDGKKLDVSFRINTEEENSSEVATRLSKFIDFIVDQNLEGVQFDNDTSTITFDDAGYVVASLQEYVIKNPDLLDNQALADLEEKIFATYEHHYDAPKLPHKGYLQTLHYPQTAKAVIGGFESFIRYNEMENNIGLFYQEGPKKEHLIRLVCEPLDNEAMDRLHMLYDELSVLAPDEMKIQLSGEHKQMIEIHATHPLQTLNLFKAIYSQNDMSGAEDILDTYSDERILQKRLGDAYEVVFSVDHQKRFPESLRKFRSDMLSHVYDQFAEYGQENLDRLGDRQLSLVPLCQFTSLKNMAAKSVFNAHANSRMSLIVMEGLIRTEMNVVTDNKQKAYRLH